MTIPESPYQRLIDIIDLLLVKNETSRDDTISIHVLELPSLPQSTLGHNLLCDALKNLNQKGLLPPIQRIVIASIYLPKIDKATEKKLLVERQLLFEKSRVQEPLGEISLKDHRVSFDDDKATITIGKLKCPLPPFKNEHYFCRAMFEYMPNEPVDWSLVYKRMADMHEELADPKKMRTVQDTMYAINNRIKEVLNTADSLFTWENKSVKRNF